MLVESNFGLRSYGRPIWVWLAFRKWVHSRSEHKSDLILSKLRHCFEQWGKVSSHSYGETSIATAHILEMDHIGHESITGRARTLPITRASLSILLHHHHHAVTPSSLLPSQAPLHPDPPQYPTYAHKVSKCTSSSPPTNGKENATGLTPYSSAPPSPTSYTSPRLSSPPSSAYSNPSPPY